MDHHLARNLVWLALGVQAAVVLAAMLGPPTVVRLLLGLVYALSVPGFAVVGLLRLGDAATEATLSVALSIALGTAAAQVLVWAGLYSLSAVLGVLTLVSTAGLLVQLRLLAP
jgi:hypothetical protein